MRNRAARTTITPGSGSRRSPVSAGGRALLAAALALAAWPHPASAQEQPFVERVHVARVLIDARVFDDRGRPITGLEPSDFEVAIDGRSIRVESVEWVGAPPENAAAAPADAPRPASPPAADATAGRDPPGRLVVFLVQKDFEPLRIIGLMQMSQLVNALLRPLTREDRVAVLSFDSRLWVWTDFTNDLSRVRSILGKRVLVSQPGPVAAAAGVSLVARLDHAGRIGGIERALGRIAEALEPVPGAKSLVLLGYGFGRWDPATGVALMDGYAEASAALQRARVAVFALNVTQADYNSLQAGLQTVATDTGGLYVSTFLFPALAIRQLSRALAGYYVLFVEKPDLGPGAHRIEVRLARRDGTVTARRSYVETR